MSKEKLWKNTNEKRMNSRIKSSKPDRAVLGWSQIQKHSWWSNFLQHQPDHFWDCADWTTSISAERDLFSLNKWTSLILIVFWVRWLDLLLLSPKASVGSCWSWSRWRSSHCHCAKNITYPHSSNSMKIVLVVIFTCCDIYLMIFEIQWTNVVKTKEKCKHISLLGFFYRPHPTKL